MKTVRVLLADDHDLVRAGIRSLLQDITGIEVVAEAADGEQAIRLVEIHRPDVALMDIRMPKLSGLEALSRVVKDFPSVRVIILSMDASKHFVLASMRSGASGYLLKNSNPAELELAIRAAARGETYLHSAVSGHLLARYSSSGDEEPDSLKSLTPRQREVLRLIALGDSTKMIARKLGLSTKTVEMHRSQLMKALDIHEIAGLVRYALRMGVITEDR